MLVLFRFQHRQIVAFLQSMDLPAIDMDRQLLFHGNHQSRSHSVEHLDILYHEH